jgi:hypothetical protein
MVAALVASEEEPVQPSNFKRQGRRAREEGKRGKVQLIKELK